MRVTTGVCYGAAGLILSGVALLAAGAPTPPATGQPTFVQNGKAGFVVAHFMYALSEDANVTRACPKGMTKGLRDVYAATPEGQRRKEETDEEYTRRINQGARALSNAPNGQNLCMNPEAGKPDPNFRTVQVPNIPAYGIDLDDQVSRANGRPAPGTCAHDDFRGFKGESGIDNQFFRVVGCSNSFQSTGQSNTNTIEMLTGSWGILFTLSGVDDIRNDPEVEVGIYANADPIEISPTQEPIAYATYAMTQDPRFRATTRGRIRDGVLTSDPVNVRFYKVTNSMYLERPLRDARMQMTLGADGVLEGYLSGYTPVEAMYDFQYGYRNGTNREGVPSPLQLRSGSSNGSAFVNNHTCHGAYHALQAAADGHRDPATGRCTSISTQYRMRAIPAFVVDAKTSSVNADLNAR